MRKRILLLAALLFSSSPLYAKKAPPTAAQKRKVSSVLVLNCLMHQAHAKRVGDVLHDFILRTPHQNELNNTSEFSLRWLTFKAKLTFDGEFSYAVLEDGQSTAVAIGRMNIKNALETQRGFDFFIPRKVSSPSLSKNPDHYYVICK